MVDRKTSRPGWVPDFLDIVCPPQPHVGHTVNSAGNPLQPYAGLARG